MAAEWAGFKTVGQCEWADFPTKILEKHWPDVPRWRDIRTLTGDDFYEKTGLRTVDVISGGFPCQPFSNAGKRKGKDDDRYLWPEMLRVIREIQPSFVIGENVPGIINLALDTVLSDLGRDGYSCQTFIVPACGVDAPHRRERVCIVAYATRNWDGFRRASSNTSKAGGQGNDYAGRAQTDDARKLRKNQPGMGRMADGIYESVYTTSADTNREYGPRKHGEQICGGGTTERTFANFWKQLRLG